MSTTTLRRRIRKTPMRDLIRGRITGRLDIDRQLDESGLPQEAADKVRRVVKRTRLKRLEKTDVANELIAHFQDGLDAGTALNELIHSFGDERQTARLIRRAKKRQRPLLWHIFAWARLSIVSFIGLYVLAAFYLLTGSPSVNTDYLALINQRSSNIPTDEAGWPLYRQALLVLNLYEEVEWDTPIPYYDELPPDQQYEHENALQPPYRFSRMVRIVNSLHPDDPGWGETVQFLRDQADTLALIRRAASKPGLGFSAGFYDNYTEQDIVALGLKVPQVQQTSGDLTFRNPERSLINVLLPHLRSMRDLARLIGADAARAAVDGDGEIALADIVAMLNMAEQVDEQPILINGLVRLAIQQQAYRSIQDILIHHHDLWTDEQLRDLAHRLAAIHVDYEAWYNGERMMFYDVLQRLYTDDGNGNGRITNEGLASVSSLSQSGMGGKQIGTGPSALITVGMPVAAVMLASREDMRQMYDRLMDMTIAEARTPLWEVDESRTMENEVEALMSSNITHVRYMLIDLLLPSMSAVSHHIETEAGARDGVMVGLALALYRRDHGRWPEKLADMVPRYLPSVPVDRLTGSPVHYRLSEEDPVVYSLGVDGDDDGGRSPRDADGRVENLKASPKSFDKPDKLTNPEFDGDWVLWPVPDQN